MKEKDKTKVHETFEDPSLLYCVAGYAFDPETTCSIIDENTGIEYYDNCKHLDHAHASVPSGYHFMRFAKYQNNPNDVTFKMLKNKKSLIPRGALEMLFEDGQITDPDNIGDV